MRLIAAAATTFARMGYANAAVADVIATAKMSRRSFYEHFKSKEDVLLAIVRQNGTALLNATRKVMESKEDPVERIEATVTLLAQIAMGLPIIGYQVMAAGEEPSKLRMNYVREFIGLLAVEVDRAHAMGKFSRPADPATIEILIGGVDALGLSYHLEGKSRQITAVAPVIRELFLRAFR